MLRNCNRALREVGLDEQSADDIRWQPPSFAPGRWATMLNVLWPVTW